MAHRVWITAGVLCLFTASLLAQPASYNPNDIGPGGPENRLGVRSCQKVSSTQIKLTFGSSFVTSVGTTKASYRLMSETDANYQAGKAASSASYTSAADVTYPTGWAGKSYSRYTVTVNFATAMQANQSYFVQLLGSTGGTCITGGKAAIWVGDTADSTSNCLGIRHLELITSTILKVTTGDGVDVTKIDNLPGNFRLTCPDDPNYGTGGRAAVQVGRRTMGDCFLPTGWPYGYFQKHEIYLMFDKPFLQGHTYSINLNAVAPVTCGTATAQLLIDDTANINPVIKVNQLGYFPSATAKYAYVGDWMGSAGVLVLDSLMTSFNVCDANTNAVVMTGTPTLRRRHAWYLQNGVQMVYNLAQEGNYREDYSYEDVWQINISSLTTPGDYYVMVPGMGRSFRFTIGSNIYAKAFDSCMIGLTHQRCGMPMQAPWSPFYRPTCHRNFTTIGTLTRQDVQGGHHDAGDYNPRSHLDVAEQLLWAYSVAPGNYYDGQCRLPETGNGVPDILDEARWELDLWTRMQDASGGVHSHIEAPSDPGQTTTGDMDKIYDTEFAVDAGVSMRVAGAWALAAEFYDALGKTTDAASFTTKATNAFNYAVNNGGLTSTNRDAIVLGSILMYRRTGNTQYRTYFETYSVFNTESSPDLYVYQQYDQQLASYYYASCPRAVDATLKTKIINAFKNRMTSWIAYANTYNYRNLRDPYAPNDWGSGAYPRYLDNAIQAYMLTYDQTYLQWIELSADFTLGCDPMNTVFINRLGQRCISAPLHINSRASPNAPIPGIQCEGPSPETGGITGGSDMATWVGMAMYPAGPWPQLHTYTDWYMVPVMNETVVTDQAKDTAVFGFLLNPPAIPPPPPGCYVFYNNSCFDGKDAAANASDDAAIATDKSPLLSGTTATFANYTSYSRGINGIVVDVNGSGTPTLSDFAFKMGNDNNPSAWSSAPAPTFFTVRPGAGKNGWTRVTFIWDDNDIQNKWLQITVHGNTRTGITSDWACYYGNAIGETGNSSASALIDGADDAAVLADPHKTFANPAAITDKCDINRDGVVNTTDSVIVRGSHTTILNGLRLITAP